MAQETPMSPEEDAKEMSALKALFDAADAEAEAEGAPDAPSMEEGPDMASVAPAVEPTGEEDMPAAGDGDLAPLMETLGEPPKSAQKCSTTRRNRSTRPQARLLKSLPI